MVTVSAETQRDVCGASALSFIVWEHSPHACYHPHLGWIVPSRLTQPRDFLLDKPTGLCLVVPSSVEMRLRLTITLTKLFSNPLTSNPLTSGLRGGIISLLGFVWGFCCSYL